MCESIDDVGGEGKFSDGFINSGLKCRRRCIPESMDVINDSFLACMLPTWESHRQIGSDDGTLGESGKLVSETIKLRIREYPMLENRIFGNSCCVD